MQNKTQKRIQTSDVIFNYFKRYELNSSYHNAHSHNFFELILFIDGNFIYNVNGKEYTLNKYDLILTPPNTTHRLINTTNYKYERYNVTFNPSLVEDIDVLDIAKNCDIINVAHSETILNIFKKLDYYCARLNIDDFISVSYCLIKELFYNIKILKNERIDEWGKLSDILRKAIKIINDDLFSINSVAEIAGKLFISETYLYKMFKNELHTTPKKYINEKKLLAAQNMILLGKKPSSVCLECGFNDYSSFYRNYLKFFKVPPSENTNE